MARKSLLSVAVDRAAEANENEPEAAPVVAAAPAERPARRVNPNAGKFHVGGYYDPADPTVEAFRILATRSRRSQQDLLHEAMRDIVAKHDAAAKFGG